MALPVEKNILVLGRQSRFNNQGFHDMHGSCRQCRNSAGQPKFTMSNIEYTGKEDKGHNLLIDIIPAWKLRLVKKTTR